MYLLKTLKTLIFILVSMLATQVNAQQQIQHKKLNDIVYTNHTDSYSQERCKLDIHLPENKKDFVTIVWFHGGGLTGGNKEIPSYLKDQGVAVVGVGYRLSPRANVEDIIQDAADAVKWTFDHIESWGGNKRKIVLAGHSAGAYLTLMLGLNENYLAQRSLRANDLMGIVSFSAQTITHFTARKEQNIADLQPTVDKLAPLYWVRKDVPPIVLITGDRELELLGRYEENAYLFRMLKLHDNKNIKLYELDGYDHGMTYPAYPLLVDAIKNWNKPSK